MSVPNIEALVSSRICHDLISPVGAISNGVELLEMAGPSPESSLIADSVNSATAKLQYFRVCFGQTSVGAMTSSREVETTARGMFDSHRISTEWQLEGEAQPREVVKLLYLLLLCAETTLPVGGVISIVQTGDTWSILVQGVRIQMQTAWQEIDGTPSDVKPAEVQFFLAAQLAREISREIHYESDESTVKITL